METHRKSGSVGQLVTRNQTQGTPTARLKSRGVASLWNLFARPLEGTNHHKPSQTYLPRWTAALDLQYPTNSMENGLALGVATG